MIEMKLILVRHGETTWNVKGLLQSRTDVRLTKRGKEQSKTIAKRLAKERIDVIFSTKFHRCEYIVKELEKLFDKDVPVHYTDELREKDFGVFEGKKLETFLKHCKKIGVSRYAFKPAGGETFFDVQKRSVRFLNKVRRKYKNKTVVFVTHSVVIKAILSFLMKKYHEDIEDQKVENASISIVEFKNNKPKIIFINYTKHLKNK